MEEQQSGDIRATLALSYAEALNGTTRTLILPGGREITVSVPAGTHDGQELRLAGRGASSAHGGFPGTLILTITVAPADYLGDPAYVPIGTDYSTEMIAPPPPPASSFPRYPPIASEGAFTNYPPQGVGGNDPYSSPSASPRLSSYARLRHRSLAVALAILLLLLVLGGSGLLYYTTIARPAQIHAQPSASTQTNIQGTTQVQANMTATAVAQATAQVTTTATAYRQIYTQATSGTPAFSDPLSHQDSHNWDESANCAFIGDAYHTISAQTDNFFSCTPNAQSPNIGNFALQVQMTIIKGDYGGVFFRADSTGVNYYLWSIDQTGSYALEVYKNDSLLNTLSSSSTSAFKTGLHQFNLITVVAQGSNFYLYVNGQFVINVNDTNYTSGQFGMVAGDTTNATEVAFSNLKIWQV